MKTSKAEREDKKDFKKKHGMKITGRSCFLIVEQKVKRAAKIKKEKKNAHR